MSNDLLLRRRMLMQAGGSPTPPTPYDAEVEYIESTGAQYIDTGIIPTVSTILQFKVYIGLANNRRIITGYFDEFNDTNDFRFFNLNNTFYFDAGGNKRLQNGNIFTYQTWINVELGNYYMKNLDTDVIVSGSQYSSSQVGFYNIYLDKDPRATAYCYNKWQQYKIYDDGNLVFDGKPVRKDGKGYLYDNVTQQLFGSQTATPYNYGPDIN